MIGRQKLAETAQRAAREKSGFHLRADAVRAGLVGLTGRLTSWDEGTTGWDEQMKKI